MNTQKLEQLSKKWRKTKSKLQKVQAKEIDLRLQIDLLLAQGKLSTVAVIDDMDKITFTRAENYSIPKAAIPDIKGNIPKETFDDTFTISYKIKPAVYDKLSGDCKDVIKKHLTIKPAPLRVTVKEA